MAVLASAFPQIVRAGYQPAPGAYAVDFVRFTWHDAARDRAVPVKIYFPKNAAGRFPVIIFSPGLGGSREGYEYLGREWAGHGYVSIHLQHPGSDPAALENAGGLLRLQSTMKKLMADPQNTINRAKDVTFAMDQLEKLNAADSPLKNKLDLSRIGMAGHSFGAATTLVVCGEELPVVKNSLADPRIQCAIAMSVPTPLSGSRSPPAYSEIKIPIFVMTGTEDTGFAARRDRRLAFDQISRPGTCFVNFNGLDHMTFSGHLFPRERGKDAKFHPLICAGTTAFWDAHLKGNAGAENWLARGGFARFIGAAGKFEVK